MEFQLVPAVKKFFLCFLLCYYCWSMYGAERDLRFTIEDSATNASFALSLGGSSDTANPVYAGWFDAKVIFDEASLQPQGFSFLGGRITVTDFDLSLSGNISYDGAGTFFTTIMLRTNNVAATPSTPNPPGSVVAPGNTLIPEEHLITINEGTNTATVSVAGETQNEQVNYAINPNPIEGIETYGIEIDEASSSPLSRELNFVFTYTVNDDQTEPLAGTNVSLITREQGVVTAQATLSLATPYGKWINENQLGLATGLEANESGLPYALIYALELPLHAASLPISIGSDGQLLLPLPQEGLRLSLQPQLSATLEPDSWEPLPAEAYVDGVESFNKGSSGQARIALSGISPWFIRMATSP